MEQIAHWNVLVCFSMIYLRKSLTGLRQVCDGDFHGSPWLPVEEGRAGPGLKRDSLAPAWPEGHRWRPSPVQSALSQDPLILSRSPKPCEPAKRKGEPEPALSPLCGIYRLRGDLAAHHFFETARLWRVSQAPDLLTTCTGVDDDTQRLERDHR